MSNDDVITSDSTDESQDNIIPPTPSRTSSETLSEMTDEDKNGQDYLEHHKISTEIRGGYGGLFQGERMEKQLRVHHGCN